MSKVSCVQGVEKTATDIWPFTRRFEYLWQDSEHYKRPTKMSAPEYIEHLMSWVQGNIDNEQMFPSRLGTYSLF